MKRKPKNELLTPAQLARLGARKTAPSRATQAEKIVERLRDHLAQAVGIDVLPSEWTVTETVNHPAHYNSHPSGVECITITEHMNFNLGNAVKYVWRVGLKSDDPIVDLEKARWYIDREITRLKKGRG